MATNVHETHKSADGKYRWVEGAGGIYRDDGGFPAIKADQHPSEQPGHEFLPMPMVVLRCRCGDPDSHASKGLHCPVAEVDVAETVLRSIEVRDHLMPS
jgi:hypothetical protein